MNNVICFGCHKPVIPFHRVGPCVARWRAAKAVETPQDASGGMRAVVRGGMILKAHD